MTNFKKLPQREKKYAKTKITILKHFLIELQTKKFSEIFIKNLALEAEISEPTFFNYFESKSDILVYFLQIWSIEMVVYSQSLEQKGLSISQNIQEIFNNTAQEVVKTPQLLLEIISHNAAGKNYPPHKITNAEKWLFFPEIENIEKIPELKNVGFNNILPSLIAKGVKSREFPKNTDTDLLFLTLVSLFFGTGLLVLPDTPKKYPFLLRKQIKKVLENIKTK